MRTLTSRSRTTGAQITTRHSVLGACTITSTCSSRTRTYCNPISMTPGANYYNEEVNIRHEQRGPSILFSVSALPQVQWRADFEPHEHFAWLAVKKERSLSMLCDLKFEGEGRRAYHRRSLGRSCRSRCLKEAFRFKQTALIRVP